jgi:hypothetical protein
MIPKKFASKLRRVYALVDDNRHSIVHAEHRIREDLERIAEFEANPELFAERHYSNCGGPDAYAVQTNISRARLAAAERIDRRQLRIDRLAQSEAEARKVEQDVLEQVARMRPTPGRVPWPDEPRDFETIQREYVRRLQESLAAAEAQRREDERLALEREAAEEAEYEKSVEQFRREIATLPPEQRKAMKAFAKAVGEAVSTGEVSIHDVFDLISGNAKLRK